MVALHIVIYVVACMIYIISKIIVWKYVEKAISFCAKAFGDRLHQSMPRPNNRDLM